MIDVAKLRIGNRTVRSAEAATIRFGFEGSGPASTRTIVAQTPRAQELLASPAGPRLTRALTRIASQADPQVGHDNLHAITLAPDVDAVAASQLRFWTGPLSQNPVEDTPEKRAFVRLTAQVWRAGTKALDGVNGAINRDGEITLMPSEARGLLAAVGAYGPSPTEPTGKNAAALVRLLPRLLRHELEHSVSPTSAYGANSGLDGLEEGIADTLQSARPSSAAARYDLPPAARYGQTDPSSARATAGWKPYPAPPAQVAARGAASNAVYVKRRSLVGDLLKLAGVNRHTRAGYAEARDLLQAQSVQRVPGRLADAIIGAQHLDPKLREPLRLAIRSITDSKESDPIAVLTKRFGITV